MSGALTAALGTLTTRLLTLGPVSFQNFSVPERIRHGTRQQLTIHRLPGGDRVIDTLGVDYAPIAWDGLLLGAGAQTQRAQLTAMLASGRPLDLWWGDQVHTVILAQLEFSSQDGSSFADFGPAQIRYHIVCEVLPPPSSGGGEDPWAYGNGQTPSTPSAAKDAGQGAVHKAARATSKPVQPSGLGLA